MIDDFFFVKQKTAYEMRIRDWSSDVCSSDLLKTGDSIRCTRNDREAGRINGGRGEVVAVDEQTRTATIQTPDGRTEALNLDAARDRHIANAYVDTTFAAQGRTADHVMVHADSTATNPVDQKSFYVGISRAKEAAKHGRA